MNPVLLAAAPPAPPYSAPARAAADGRSPAECRYLLGVRLAVLREQAGLTLGHVGRLLFCSASKLSRIESGVHRAADEDVNRLADLYAVNAGPQRQELLALARAAWAHGAFHGYGDVAGVALRHYLDVEVHGLRCLYESEFVPAVLRTLAYARALWGPVTDLEASRRYGLLSLRQHRFLTRPVGGVRVVLGEGCLQNQVGGPDVMREQVQRLKAIAEAGLAQVRVLPGVASARLAARVGAFSLLHLGAERIVMVAQEKTPGEVRLVRDRRQRHSALFDRLWEAGEPLPA